MDNVLILFLILTGWGTEERSGTCKYSAMDLDDFAAEDSVLTYDVTNYRLLLNLDIPAETLSAEAELTLNTLEALDSIKLHFVGLEISKVEEGGQQRFFVRQDSFLIVSLGRIVSTGSNLMLKVYYHGKPKKASGGFGKGIYINPDENAVTYTCNAPWGAKYWFPCQDNPADKATMEIFVTVPNGYEVISNGKLDSVNRLGAEWTFHWVESHPIATYLIAIAASKNYALTTDSATVNGTQVPIFHWVLKPDSANITPKLMVVADVMEYFSSLFYPYPFADEKYAHVAAPVPGAMENQTCTHINTGIKWDDWDCIVAHEFSHSWWGNASTCRKLKHMWLNEGFATYCEALWVEHRDGAEAYQNYYETKIAAKYLRSFQSRLHPILDVPWSQIYSPLTYEKPASVLHMLRRLTGDDDFFKILKTYGLRYKDSTVLSSDFEAVVAEVTGTNYSWFFDEWLRKPAHPEYQYTWSSAAVGDSVQITINLSQTQHWPADVGIFTMPVEFGLLEGEDTFVVSFTDTLKRQSFSLKRPVAPDSLLFDPHGNLLCKVLYSGVAEEQPQSLAVFDCAYICNGLLDYTIKLSNSNPINLSLYDATGSKVMQWNNLSPSGQLNLSHFPSGVYYMYTSLEAIPFHRIILIK